MVWQWIYVSDFHLPKIAMVLCPMISCNGWIFLEWSGAYSGQPRAKLLRDQLFLLDGYSRSENSSFKIYNHPTQQPECIEWLAHFSYDVFMLSVSVYSNGVIRSRLSNLWMPLAQLGSTRLILCESIFSQGNDSSINGLIFFYQKRCQIFFARNSIFMHRYSV